MAENYPAIHIVVALIGERPEEVTDMRRSIKGEVYSSTFDEQVEHQCETSDRALYRAKRLVESGEDVLLVLDSLTRLARAFNVKLPSSGKTLSGGMDPLALYPPKQFFGAARNCEEGGSLTIVATALIDTGSRLDDLDLRGVQGHWQHGAAPRPHDGGAAHLPCGCYGSLWHSARGTVAESRNSPTGLAVASHDRSATAAIFERQSYRGY